MSNSDGLWAGTASGLFRLPDGGQSWQRADSIPEVAVYSLVKSDAGALYAGTDARGVYSSTNGGKTWLKLPGLENLIILSLYPLDAETIFAGTGGDGLFVTHDRGRTWQPIADFQKAFVPMISPDPRDKSTVYASSRRALMRSRDAGASWEPVQGGLESEQVYAETVTPDGKSLLAGTASHGIFISQDDGATWHSTDPQQKQGGLMLGPVPEGHAVLSFASAGNTILAGTTDGVLRSTDQGLSWSPSDFRDAGGFGHLQIHDLAFDPADGSLFAATDDGLYRRSAGQWGRVGSGVLDLPVLAVSIATSDPNLIYVGTSHKGVYSSEDAGRTWSAAGGDLGGRASVAGLLADPGNPQNLFARVLYERIYKSTDGGASWHTVWTGMPDVTEIDAMAIDPGNPKVMYAGGDDQVFNSNDGGESWVGGGLSGVTTFSFSIDPTDSSKLLAGTTDGTYGSKDNGKTWTRAGLAGTTVIALGRDSNGAVIAATKYEGVYASSDGGLTFTRFGAGLDGASVVAMVVDGARGRIYAATTIGVYCLQRSMLAKGAAGGADCG